MGFQIGWQPPPVFGAGWGAPENLHPNNQRLPAAATFTTERASCTSSRGRNEMRSLPSPLDNPKVVRALPSIRVTRCSHSKNVRATATATVPSPKGDWFFFADLLKVPAAEGSRGIHSSHPQRSVVACCSQLVFTQPRLCTRTSRHTSHAVLGPGQQVPRARPLLEKIH